MDALLAKFAVTTIYEKFADAPAKAPPAPAAPAAPAAAPAPAAPAAPAANSMSTIVIIAWVIWGIFFISFGSAAAWVSWEANTLAEWNSVAKGVFSFFSFFGGFSYLIVYFVHKLDLVMALRACKRSTGELPSIPKM